MSRAKLSLSLYKANLSLLRHSSSCILCGISNSFIQIHIANSCTCFSCASLLRTMRYNAAGAQLHCAPDRTLGYAILFSLPFSPKHIGALRVHELSFKFWGKVRKFEFKFSNFDSKVFLDFLENQFKICEIPTKCHPH